jgi:hypothetical protein
METACSRSSSNLIYKSTTAQTADGKTGRRKSAHALAEIQVADASDDGSRLGNQLLGEG